MVGVCGSRIPGGARMMVVLWCKVFRPSSSFPSSLSLHSTSHASRSLASLATHAHFIFLLRPRPRPRPPFLPREPLPWLPRLLGLEPWKSVLWTTPSASTAALAPSAGVAAPLRLCRELDSASSSGGDRTPEPLPYSPSPWAGDGVVGRDGEEVESGDGGRTPPLVDGTRADGDVVAAREAWLMGSMWLGDVST